MIRPTVGRVVLYHPGQNSAEEGFSSYSGQPHAAIVAYVWNERMVNLTVFDHAGVAHSRSSVQLVQPEDTGPQFPGSAYCEWMPYQKGQAAKTEELERRVAGNVEQPATLPDGWKVAVEQNVAGDYEINFSRGERMSGFIVQRAFTRDELAERFRQFAELVETWDAPPQSEQLEQQWRKVEPQPTVTEFETLMREYGEGNVRIEPNGDVMVRGTGR